MGLRQISWSAALSAAVRRVQKILLLLGAPDLQTAGRFAHLPMAQPGASSWCWGRLWAVLEWISAVAAHTQSYPLSWPRPCQRSLDLWQQQNWHGSEETHWQLDTLHDGTQTGGVANPPPVHVKISPCPFKGWGQWHNPGIVLLEGGTGCFHLLSLVGSPAKHSLPLPYFWKLCKLAFQSTSRKMEVICLITFQRLGNTGEGCTELPTPLQMKVSESTSLETQSWGSGIMLLSSPSLHKDLPYLE